MPKTTKKKFKDYKYALYMPEKGFLTSNLTYSLNPDDAQIYSRSVELRMAIKCFTKVLKVDGFVPVELLDL